MAQTSWFTWQVPEARLNQYLFYMVMVVFIVPYIAGIMFTSLGYLLNVLWFDMIFYMWLRNKELIEKGKDDNESDRME
tara:strand:- start:179 stop:412 length:234 start_codon:yes stop_codon:yes gene_type:complete